MEYMAWDVSQYTQARDLFNLPAADAFRDTTGNLLSAGKNCEMTRRKDVVDKWASEWREKIAILQRLVGEDKTTATGRGFFRR